MRYGKTYLLVPHTRMDMLIALAMQGTGDLPVRIRGVFRCIEETYNLLAWNEIIVFFMYEKYRTAYLAHNIDRVNCLVTIKNTCRDLYAGYENYYRNRREAAQDAW